MFLHGADTCVQRTVFIIDQPMRPPPRSPGSLTHLQYARIQDASHVEHHHAPPYNRAPQRPSTRAGLCFHSRSRGSTNARFDVFSQCRATEVRLRGVSRSHTRRRSSTHGVASTGGTATARMPRLVAETAAAPQDPLRVHLADLLALPSACLPHERAKEAGVRAWQQQESAADNRFRRHAVPVYIAGATRHRTRREQRGRCKHGEVQENLLRPAYMAWLVCVRC